MKKIIIRFFLVTSFLLIHPCVSLAEEEDSAVIIMYHRIGEEKFPTTNITLDQIDQHIAELSRDIYNIVPLKEIISALKEGRKLPERTISITIDDGYLSIYKEAWPRFKKAGIPFTLFVSTESVNGHNKNSMTWDQIRELEKDPLIDIGHHGHIHAHMTEMNRNEALNDLKIADDIYQKELGYIPSLFAYPYGEYSLELIEALKEKNYDAFLGQYSSPVSSSNNFMMLPRFAFNESYADINRFKLVINSRALAVRDVLPRSPSLENNPPSIGFTVNEAVKDLSILECFPSHLSEAAEITLLGNNRVEIRFDQPFPSGRARMNCTMPGPDNRWYWFGMPFFNLEN